MAQTSMIHVRVDDKLKAEAAEKLANFGLTLSDAVRILLTRIAKEGGLPAGLTADPDRMVVTVGAQQAIALTFSALAQPGGIMLTEKTTFPPVKHVAAMFNIRLHGVETDADGMIPEALEEACIAHPPAAVRLAQDQAFPLQLVESPPHSVSCGVEAQDKVVLHQPLAQVEAAQHEVHLQHLVDLTPALRLAAAFAAGGAGFRNCSAHGANLAESDARYNYR